MKGAAVMGRDWHCGNSFKQYFLDAGFEDVEETRFVLPCNTWPRGKRDKMLGLYQMTNILDGLSAMSTRVLTQGLGWTVEEIEVLLVDVRKDLRTKSIHGYWPA